MRISVLLLIMIDSVFAIAQENTFYKNELLTKEVPEKKAKYLRSKFNSGDTLILQYSRLSDGFVFRESKWVSNNPVGVWFEFALDGNLISSRDFSTVFYKRPLPNIYNNSIDSVNWKGCQPAIFKTGKSDLYRYLAMNITYPIESRSLGNTGKVFINFVISKEGKPQPYSIQRGVDPYINLATWELIDQMPTWNPATLEGVPIESYFTLPISYRL
jgi:hypothetical protein